MKVLKFNFIICKLCKHKLQKEQLHFVTTKTRIIKTKKVGDILKNLGLNEIGTGKSDLSISHDNILYK